MIFEKRTCAAPSCDLQVFDRYDKFCIRHIPISPNTRVRDFDITESTSMTALVRDLRAITRYTWYLRPDEAFVHVAELSLKIASEWKVVSYDAIARLAVFMHYIHAVASTIKYKSNCFPEPPDLKPLSETRASLMYLLEHFQLHAAKLSDLSKDVKPLFFQRRRMYLQAADVWWKSRLKIEALRESLGWLCMSLKPFTASVRAARDGLLDEHALIVLSMDAEVLGGLAEVLFKTVLLHYQELLTV